MDMLDELLSAMLRQQATSSAAVSDKAEFSAHIFDMMHAILLSVEALSCGWCHAAHVETADSR